MKLKSKITLILSVIACLLAIGRVSVQAAEPCNVTIVDEFYDDEGNLEKSITRETKIVMSGSTLRNVTYKKYDGYVNYDQAISDNLSKNNVLYEEVITEDTTVYFRYVAGYTKIGATCYLFNVTELTDDQLYEIGNTDGWSNKDWAKDYILKYMNETEYRVDEKIVIEAPVIDGYKVVTRNSDEWEYGYSISDVITRTVSYGYGSYVKAELPEEYKTQYNGTDTTGGGNGGAYPTFYYVLDTVEVSNIELNETKVNLKVGEKVTLSATITPENATNKNITWSTSDAKVATVSNGEVTAVGNGTATITVTSANGKTATCTVTVTTDVAEVKLDKESVVIGKDKSVTLNATITPDTASNQTLTWTSSNKKIATVDKNGKVTGKKAGTVTITVTTANGKTATCTVTVATVKLNASKFALQVGKSTKALKIEKSYEKDKVKSWTSSNKKIATVNKNGKITAKKTGKVTITVTMESGATAKCTVTVQKGKVTTKSLKMEQKKVTLQKGKKVTLTVTRNPISATEKITWTSSDKKIATVNSKGVVTGKKAGTVTITAKTSNGKKITCKVTVKNPKVTLEKTKATIKVGKTTTIKIKSTFPENDKVKSYKSSNTKVATVNKNGKVTGKKAGTANITVTMESGAKVTFKVIVKKK